MDNRRKEDRVDVAWRQPQRTSRPEISREEYLRRKAARKRRQRKRLIKRILMLILILLLIAVAIIYICRTWFSDSSIVGTWDYDSATVYRFDDNGKGTLLLPNTNYDFSYLISEDVISIDFEDENAEDSSYTYSIKGRKLSLRSVEMSDSVYVLKRVKGAN